MSDTLLRVEDLKIYYPVAGSGFGKKEFVKAVDGVTFEVKKGEVFGIVGESGCGKSTLGRGVCKLENLTSGHVYLDGEDITEYNDRRMRSVRKKVQMVFQDPYASLNPRMSVFDIIAEPLLVHHLYQDKADLEKKVLDLLHRVGLDDYHANRYPHEFSGGQRQRIGIARALAVEPSLIIADELNVKEVKFADDVESFISYSFKPQLRTVGPKYGKLLGGIRQALTDINGTAAMNELRTNGVLKLDINGNDVELTEEDLLIETAQTEGYVSESDGETSVVLDTNLTPELIEEGFVREIISKIQTMRKEAGFEVMDKIVVYAHGNDKIQDVMKTHEDEIKSEVLADEMVLGETDGYVKEWNINKEAVTMGVKKL